MLKLRASKIGGCARAYVMDIRAGKEQTITDKQRIYFAVGKALEPVIMMAAGYKAKKLFKDKVEVEIDLGGGIILTGHPDSEDGEYIIECKTMRSFAYKKLISNGLEAQFPQYLVQGSVYAKGRGKKGVKFLCLDKDASTIQVITVDWAMLEPYWQIAVKNARKIARWVDKVKLPGRDPDLPRWYCSPAYCQYVDCRYHFARNQKPEWMKKETSK